MNCILHAYSTAIFSRTGCFAVRSSICGFSAPLWRRSIEHGSIRTGNLEFLLTRLQAQCYSSRKASGSMPRSRKLDPKPVMEVEKDEFFVVRKGDLVGVYKNLRDCQAQVGSSICDPPVSVYKGYSMPKDTEDYLLSHGLKNALYTIRAADLNKELFGMLVPCPFQQPISSKGETSSKDLSKKILPECLEAETGHFCILEFDGSSKGNPGQAGAGAVLRADDGSVICKLREGLGITTSNVAEYRAMILGLRYALEKGFTSIRVLGDSKLVCLQVQGLWKAKNQNMCNLSEVAKKLKKKFLSFQVTHVLRKLNSEADAQANLAVRLAEGQVEEEINK